MEAGVRVDRIAAFALALVMVSGCASIGGIAGRTATPGLAPLAPIYELPTMSLADKAAVLEQRIIEDHTSMEGLLLYRVTLPLANNYEEAHNIADAPSWLGFRIGSLALKQAVEPDDGTLSSLWLSVRALALNFELTGVPGLLARSYVRTDGPLPWMATAATHPGKFWQPAIVPGWWYRNGPAKGHYFYSSMGLSVVIGLEARGDLVLPPALSALVRSTQISMLRHLAANGYNVTDATGQMTQYGLLSEWFVDGFSALGLVAMMRTAATAGDPGAARDLRAMLEGDAGGAIANTLVDRSTLFATVGPDKFSDTQAIYANALAFWITSTGSRSDNELLADIRAGLRHTWTYERYSRKSFTIYAHELVNGGQFYEHDIARETLELFPDDKRIIAPLNCREIDKVNTVANIAMRSHVWKTNYFKRCERVPGSQRTDVEYSGQDYHFAYWLGRWAGWLE